MHPALHRHHQGNSARKGCSVLMSDRSDARDCYACEDYEKPGGRLTLLLPGSTYFSKAIPCPQSRDLVHSPGAGGRLRHWPRPPPLLPGTVAPELQPAPPPTPPPPRSPADNTYGTDRSALCGYTDLDPPNFWRTKVVQKGLVAAAKSDPALEYFPDYLYYSPAP